MPFAPGPRRAFLSRDRGRDGCSEAVVVVTGTVSAARSGRHAATLAVAVVALVALHHGRPPSSKPAVPATTTGPSRLGPRPRDPGPIPRNVDDAAVAAAWNTAWREDPTCRPGAGRGPGAGVSYGAPARRCSRHCRFAPSGDERRSPTGQPLRSLWRSGEAAGRRRGRRCVHPLCPSRARHGGAHLLPGSGRQYRAAAAVSHGRKSLLPARGRRAARRAAEHPARETSPYAPLRRRGVRARPLQPRNLDRPRGRGPVRPKCQRGWRRRWRPEPGIDPAGRAARRRWRRQAAHPDRVDGIVPSGVATVTLHFPAIHHGSRHLPALNPPATSSTTCS